MLILEGQSGKSVHVTGATVRILKEGGIFSAARDKTLPIRNISSVEVKKPGFFAVGFIQFSIAGGVARDSSWTFTGGAFDAVTDENSVTFNGDDAYEMALRIKNYVENFREAPTLVAQAPVSAADEIMKLKTLMDQGILTPEEFNAKKRQLLGL